MDEYKEILEKLPFFENQDLDDCILVLNCIDSEIIKKSLGEYIYKTSQPFDCIVVVLKGTIISVNENTDGSLEILKRYESGEYFGLEYASSFGTRLKESLLAETDCSLLMINVERLLCPCWSHCEHHEMLMQKASRVFGI